jgi:hypothetical protein
MNLEGNSLDSLPKEVKEFIKSKRKWIEESEKTPAELSPNKRIFCNECSHETNHTCKAHYRRHILSNYPDVVFMHTSGYHLWMCAGCETCTLEHYIDTEMFDFDDEPEDFARPEVTSEFFPKRTEYNLIPKHFRQLPARLDAIYQESIFAFNNEIPVLCTIGIRALIEGICADQEITGGNLEKKIDGLASILPKNIVSNLHNLRFMGNEAAHELTAPSQEELQLAIGICEDLLNYLYELDYKASSLDQIRKRRKSSEDNIDSSLSG